MSRGFLRVFDSIADANVVVALASAVGGVICLLAAVLLLRRIGPGYRIARLLAATPEISLVEVAGVASSGQRLYVRARGRVSSEEEFPDENQRPLVFRRRRIERADGRNGWRLLDEERLAVPFGIEDREHLVSVDADALGDGLVVMPRESVGTASDLTDDLRESIREPLAADVAVRLRIDQVSAVEHATVAGVPVRWQGGTMLTAGLGRPLVLSTLEPQAAMRVLAGERRSAAVAAAGAIVGGVGLIAVAAVALLAGW